MENFLVLYLKMIDDEQKVNRKFQLKRHSEMALYLILDNHRNNSYLNYLINAKLPNGDFTKTFRQQDVVGQDDYIIWHLLQPNEVFWSAYKVHQMGMTYEEYEFSDYYLNLE